MELHPAIVKNLPRRVPSQENQVQSAGSVVQAKGPAPEGEDADHNLGNFADPVLNQEKGKLG